MNVEQENEIMAMKGDERSSEKSSLLPESQSEKPEVENDDGAVFEAWKSIRARNTQCTFA